MDRVRLGILLSGRGRSLENIIDRIGRGEVPAEVVLVVSSDPEAAGLRIGREGGMATEAISPDSFPDTASFSAAITSALRNAAVDLICMAGFVHLYRIPREYEGKVMNIHPALIPSFCGPGFFGARVHRRVLRRGVKISGCTVHFADNEYDQGPIILQRTVPVLEGDTPDTLAARVFEEEREAYPEAIRLFAEGRLLIRDGKVEILQRKP